MSRIKIINMSLSLATLTFCGTCAASGSLTCTSPGGNVTIGFASDAKGMRWSLTRNGKTVVEPSRLGLSFSMFKVPNRSLGEMRIIKKDTRQSDTTLTNEIYRRRTIRDRYNELSVTLEEVDEPRHRLGFVFRAYDEGAAFRYVVPEQDGVAVEVFAGPHKFGIAPAFDALHTYLI